MSAIPEQVDARWQIALVDDDATVLRSLSRMLTCAATTSRLPSADAFLSSLRELAAGDVAGRPAHAGTDGLTLQSLLVRARLPHPDGVPLGARRRPDVGARDSRRGDRFPREAVRRADAARVARARGRRRATRTRARAPRADAPLAGGNADARGSTRYSAGSPPGGSTSRSRRRSAPRRRRSRCIARA